MPVAKEAGPDYYVEVKRLLKPKLVRIQKSSLWFFSLSRLDALTSPSLSRRWGLDHSPSYSHQAH